MKKRTKVERVAVEVCAWMMFSSFRVEEHPDFEETKLLRLIICAICGKVKTELIALKQG